MKKLPKRFAAAALVALAAAFTSCGGDDGGDGDGTKKYNISITAPGGNGSGRAEVNGAAVTRAAAGATVTLVALPAADYKLDEWTVAEGGAILADRTAFTTTFVMPAADVRIEASFEADASDVLKFITDPAFKAYAQSNMTTDKWDKDGNGTLSSAEAAAVTKISLSGGYGSPKVKVRSLAGIEHFTGILWIDCQKNELATLDVSACTELIYLYCYENKLTSLIVSACAALRLFECNDNLLTALDVSQNTALTRLNCRTNLLTALDVSKNTALTEVRCGNGLANPTPMTVTVAACSDILTDIGVWYYHSDEQCGKIYDFNIAYNGVTVTTPGVAIGGTTWAEFNVDAPGKFTAYRWQYGMFYQWNRNTAWANNGSTVTGWNATGATGSAWTTANDPCPAGWRLPTQSEQSDLLRTANVTGAWTNISSINGRKFTDKGSGQWIFLPAAGYRQGSSGSLQLQTISGYYWTGTSQSGGNAYAMAANSSDSQSTQSIEGTAFGYSVRCVKAG